MKIILGKKIEKQKFLLNKPIRNSDLNWNESKYLRRLSKIFFKAKGKFRVWETKSKGILINQNAIHKKFPFFSFWFIEYCFKKDYLFGL